MKSFLHENSLQVKKRSASSVARNRNKGNDLLHCQIVADSSEAEQVPDTLAIDFDSRDAHHKALLGVC